MHSVELSQKAQKFLAKLDDHARRRIENRLKNLGSDPVPQDSKFICRQDNDKVFRYRIGNYRALYEVKPAEETILIAEMDKRPRAYDR